MTRKADGFVAMRILLVMRMLPSIVVGLCTVLPGRVYGQEAVDLRDLDLPHWTLEEEFRLGSVDGANASFVRPWLAEVDASGRLYVVDPGLPAVRVFDAEGNFLRDIGHEGEGPGEYTVPVSFGFIGDTSWIVDGVTRRVAFFSEDGQVLEDFALIPEEAGMQPPQPVEVLGPDDFLVVIPPGPDRFFRGHGVGRVTFRQSIMRRNRSGTRADTLVTCRVAAGYIIIQADEDGFGVVPSTPIHQSALVSYDPECEEITWVRLPVESHAEAGEFLVTVRRPDGAAVAQRRFLHQPVPLPESVKDSIRDDMRSKFDPERGKTHLEVELKHLGLPDYLPPVTGGVKRGQDGTRWIPRESLPGLTAARYLVTDSVLNPLATLQLPPSAMRLTGPIDGARVWVVEKDEWDVQYLVRYRIVRHE